MPNLGVSLVPLHRGHRSRLSAFIGSSIVRYTLLLGTNCPGDSVAAHPQNRFHILLRV